MTKRIAMARTRAGKLHRVWKANLPPKLKLRLYVSGVCSILTYGSEAWRLDERAQRAINGANAMMLAHMTGKSIHEESASRRTHDFTCREVRRSERIASHGTPKSAILPTSPTFDILRWIRARHLQWLGHILRLPEMMQRDGTECERLLKSAVQHICDYHTDGDILMDAPAAESWEDLLNQAADRDAWKARVKALRTSPTKKWHSLTAKLQKKHRLAVRIEIFGSPNNALPDSNLNNPFSKAARKNQCNHIQYTFVPRKQKKKKKTAISNTAARAQYYAKKTGDRVFLNCIIPRKSDSHIDDTESPHDTDDSDTSTNNTNDTNNTSASSIDNSIDNNTAETKTTNAATTDDKTPTHNDSDYDNDPDISNTSSLWCASAPRPSPSPTTEWSPQILGHHLPHTPSVSQSTRTRSVSVSLSPLPPSISLFQFSVFNDPPLYDPTSPHRVCPTDSTTTT